VPSKSLIVNIYYRFISPPFGHLPYRLLSSRSSIWLFGALLNHNTEVFKLKEYILSFDLWPFRSATGLHEFTHTEKVSSFGRQCVRFALWPFCTSHRSAGTRCNSCSRARRCCNCVTIRRPLRIAVALARIRAVLLGAL